MHELNQWIEGIATHGVLWVFIIIVLFKLHGVAKQVAAVGEMLGQFEDKFDERFPKPDDYY